MQFKFVILIVFSMIYAVSAMIECPVNICATVRCVNVVKADCEVTNNGIFEEHGGFCGCCPTCLRKIHEGESCHSLLLLGAPRTAACDIGLVCDRDTQTCIKKATI